MVTISIPLYQCEDFIERCLESVRLQTYQNVEVTLINDQTKDQSAAIAERFISKNALTAWRLIHLEKNSGLSVGRNKGIDTAAGKYIFFLDCDDEILPQTIEEMVKIAEGQSLQMVVGNVETIHAETGTVKNIFNITTAENVITGNLNVLNSFVRGEFPEMSWNKLILLEFLKSNQLYFKPDIFGEDALHSFLMALKIESIGFVHLRTYRYYLHKSSIIHNRKRKHILDWTTIATIIDSSLKSESNYFRKKLLSIHLANFKNMTLAMNWKAQTDEILWKESYSSYKKLSKLSLANYLSGDIPMSIKKADLFNRLPTDLGFRFFKWRWER